MQGSPTVKKRLAATSLLVIGLASPVPAMAEGSGASSDSRVVTSQECLRLMTKLTRVAGPARTAECTYRVETDVSEPVAVSALAPTDLSGLSVRDRVSLRTAVATGAVRSKRYSQSLTGAAWTATQSGTFYYDGQRVWVGSAYRGRTGSHHCNVNYAVGFGLSLQNCSESGSNTQRNMYQSWYVSPLKVGVGWSAGSTIYLHRAGHTSY